MPRPDGQERKVVRIGGASGYWGDTASGPRQLVERGGVDYLAFDYLAESTMAVLAKAKARNPGAGYATDFIELAMRPLLARITADGVRVIANAGGVNLPAARQALEQLAAELGLTIRIGVVEGDDLDSGTRLQPLGGQPRPERFESLNAYLGAFPIAAALDAGADIVLTGRCVDSALILGPLIHEFGWRPQDHDLLAAGSLCGHLLECGAQAAGGNFTDWRETVDGWADMGFPIADVSPDGGFVLSKPAGSGGKVSRLTVAEQLVYEIGDPRAYLLPDVTCDFADVRLEEIGTDQVRVSGAKGSPPTATLKATGTAFDGFACRAATAIVGVDCREKAQRMGEAILRKVATELAQAGLAPLQDHAIDVLAGETSPELSNAPSLGAAVLRLAVRHATAKGAELFAREFVGAGLSMSPGLAPLSPGRPGVSPLIAVHSFLVDKAEVTPVVRVEDVVRAIPFSGPYAAPNRAAAAQVDPGPAGDNLVTAPLVTLAVARSGDKGDDANIGVIARRAEWLPWIRQALSCEVVQVHFAATGVESVERFELPGLGALNFVLRGALGGGGPGSLHLDPLAKTFAQRLLAVPIHIPAALLDAPEGARWT